MVLNAIERGENPRETLKQLARSTISPAHMNVLQRTSVMLKHENLYRGSRTPGLKMFEDSLMTNCAGVYLALNWKVAKDYAHNGPDGLYKKLPQWQKKEPRVYTCSAYGSKLLGLRRSESMISPIISVGFSTFLNNIVNNSAYHTALKGLKRNWSETELSIISEEDRLREMVDAWIFTQTKDKLNGTVSEYLMALGFDGILDKDGDVLIFRPKSVKISREERV